MEWQPLDFEKPIFELERRLQDLKSHSTKHDVDLGSAVKELEAKLREMRRHVYEQFDGLAAGPNRPAHSKAVRARLHSTLFYELG